MSVFPNKRKTKSNFSSLTGASSMFKLAQRCPSTSADAQRRWYKRALSLTMKVLVCMGRYKILINTNINITIQPFDIYHVLQHVLGDSTVSANVILPLVSVLSISKRKPRKVTAWLDKNLIHITRSSITIVFG